ncbi:MAG: hypothetical protein HYY06_18825 [Deltaproteobacteria bacterium]|nr:hypothetical protein [Deltaproteobacteria bacterium]
MVKLLNAVFVGVLAVGLMLQSAFDTGSAMVDLSSDNNNDLAELEDAYYHNAGDADLGLRLAAEYRDRGEPELALAALRQMAPNATALPAIQHQYSLIYSDLGKLPEAVASGRTAVVRCARSLQYVTNGSATMCSEGQLTRMELHLSVMERLVKWGVVDPKLDPERTHLAYELSFRTARLASVPTSARSDSQ